MPPPLSKRRYRFDAKFRAEYPAAKAFLAKQDGSGRDHRATAIIPRDALAPRDDHRKFGRRGERRESQRRLATALDAVSKLFGRRGDRA